MRCPYCGREAEWVANKEIYGRNYGRSYMIWLCRPCDAYVGCHGNTKRPLGTMANKSLRETRVMAHSVIDPLWKSGQYTRSVVYQRLADAFGEEVHIGESDEDRCFEIMATARKVFARVSTEGHQ